MLTDKGRTAKPESPVHSNTHVVDFRVSAQTPKTKQSSLQSLETKKQSQGKSQAANPLAI
jgi:hypothetical protein